MTTLEDLERRVAALEQKLAMGGGSGLPPAEPALDKYAEVQRMYEYTECSRIRDAYAEHQNAFPPGTTADSLCAGFRGERRASKPDLTAREFLGQRFVK